MPGSVHARLPVLTMLATALFLVGSSAQPAEAQLGRLKKIAEDAAKKKVAGDQPPEPAKKAAATVVPNEDATITIERLDAVVAVLTPLVADAERRAAAAAAVSGYEAAKKETEKCMEAFANAGLMPTAAAAEQLDKTAKQSERLTKTSQSAMAAGDYRTALYAQDSSTVLQVRGAGLMFGGKCKPYPFQPAAMLDASAASLANAAAGKGNARDGSAEGGLDVPASARAGMSTQMFGRTRERAALYALLAAKAITNNQAGTEGVFTDAEIAALEARKAVLMKLAPLFRGNALRYTTWADLKAW